MYCENCGKEIKMEAAFCPYCGRLVKQEDLFQAAGTAVEKTHAPKFPLVIVSVCAAVVFACGGFLAAWMGWLPFLSDYNEPALTYTELKETTGAEIDEDKDDPIKAEYNDAVKVQFSDEMETRSDGNYKKAKVTVPNMEKIYLAAESDSGNKTSSSGNSTASASDKNKKNSSSSEKQEDIIRYIKEEKTYRITYEIDVPVNKEGEPDDKTVEAILQSADERYKKPDLKEGTQTSTEKLGEAEIYIGMTVQEVREILGTEDDRYNLNGAAALQYDESGVVVGVYDTLEDELTGKEIIRYQEEWNKKDLGEGYSTYMTIKEVKKKISEDQKIDAVVEEDLSWSGYFTEDPVLLGDYQVVYYWEDDEEDCVSSHVEIMKKEKEETEPVSEDSDEKNTSSNKSASSEGKDTKTSDKDSTNKGTSAAASDKKTTESGNKTAESSVIGTWHIDRERTGNLFGTSIQEGEEFVLRADHTFSWYAGYEGGEGTWSMDGNRIRIEYSVGEGDYPDGICEIKGSGADMTLVLSLDDEGEYQVFWVKE